MPKPNKHKRKKPKSGRAGSLLCKPHKRPGADRRTLQEKSADEIERIMRGSSAALKGKG